MQMKPIKIYTENLTGIMQTQQTEKYLRQFWSYPCSWLRMCRLTNIMAAGGRKNEKVRHGLKKVLFALVLTALQGTQWYEWSQ